MVAKQPFHISVTDLLEESVRELKNGYGESRLDEIHEGIVVLLKLLARTEVPELRRSGVEIGLRVIAGHLLGTEFSGTRELILKTANSV